MNDYSSSKELTDFLNQQFFKKYTLPENYGSKKVQEGQSLVSHIKLTAQQKNMIRERMYEKKKAQHLKFAETRSNIIPQPDSITEKEAKPSTKSFSMFQKEAKDFFGRTIQSSKNSPQKVATVIPVSKQIPAVRYKYQEGFTDAIRRRILVKDFY